MNLRGLGALLCAFALSVVAEPARPAQTSSPVLSINTAKGEIRIVEGGIHLRLPAVRPVATGSASLQVDWLDEEDRVLSQATESWPADGKPGRIFDLTLPSPFAQMEAEHHEQALWHRLRCRLVSSQDKTLATQIVSVSQFPSNLFRSSVLVSAKPGCPAEFTIVVRTAKPLRPEPISGVSVKLFWEQGKAGAPFAEALTDSTGTTRMDVIVPGDAMKNGDSTVAFRVEARLFDYLQVGDGELEKNTESTFLLQTDKGIYQPGQLMRIRSAAFDALGKVWRNTPALVIVSDPQSHEVRRFRLTTNRFGVVAADWRIPEDAGTGMYEVRVSLLDAEDGETRRGMSSTYVRVQRYELPQFSVQATAAKSWYFYDQPVEINVDAKYLHGKPLPAAKVTLREDNVGYWDSKLKKRVELTPQRIESEVREGVARFHFSPTLPPPQARSTQDKREVEITVETEHGEKETARANIVLASQSVQFEVIGQHRLSSGLPGTLYVRALDPANQPVRCAFELRITAKNVRPISLSGKTDGLGYARLDKVKPPRLRDRDDEWTLTVSTTNPAGRRSTSEWTQEFRDAPVRVSLDRHELTGGDPLRVHLASVAESQIFDVAVRCGYSILSVETVKTANHQADLMVPTTPDWSGQCEVQGQRQLAMRPEDDDDDAEEDLSFEDVADAEPFYVHARPRVVLSAKTDREEYRPGTQALGTVEVREPSGEAVPAAVGVVVVDEAVLQRERDLMGLWREGGWGTNGDGARDVPKQEPDSSLSHDEQRLISMLHGGNIEAILFSNTFTVRAFELYGKRAVQDLAPTKKALAEWSSPDHDLPLTLSAVERLAAQLHVTLRPQDPWGRPYIPTLYRAQDWMRLKVTSAGPDGRLHTSDDVMIEVLSWRWFNRQTRVLSQILAAADPFPSSEAELRSLLARKKQASLLRLPAGWLEFKFGEDLSRTFAPAIVIFPQSQRRGAAGVLSNQTQKLARAPWIELWGVEKNPRFPRSRPTRYLLLRFQGIPRELRETESLRHAKTLRPAALPSGVTGQVTDITGASIVNAVVTISRAGSDGVFRVETDETGRFRANVAPGNWDVLVASPGFEQFRVLQVVVVTGLFTDIQVRLNVATMSETVEVSASAPVLQTSAAVVSFRKAAPPPPLRPPTSAPEIRVREEFPETLLWAPLLETDAQGRVQIPFSLADSITSWRFRAVASTEDGRIGFAKTKFTTTQPLFLTYAPPERLTVGDEITVPFSVHNYLPNAQKLSLSAEASAGLEVQHAPSASLQVDAGAEQPADVRLKATEVSSAAVSKLVARGNAESDAIARKVRVEPLGRPLQTVSNQLLQSNLSLSIEGRPRAIDQARRVELQIYPDLLSHVFAASDALLLRPIGCSEQIISSAYPNLFTLQRLEQDASPEAESLRKRAKDNLEIGYERLLKRQTAKGGFSFFDGGEPSAPLTAYAIRFLRDLATVFPVDPDVGKRAAQWLVQSQEDLGQWRTGSLREDSAMIIAALSGEKEPPRNAIRRATEWLERDSRRDSPLVLATLLRAALHRGDMDAAREFHSRLLAGTPESSFSGASIEERSELRAMFSQRGRAVSVEGAAAIAAALTEAEAAGLPPHRDLVAAAVNAILRLKDEHQTWYTTHATVSALEGLMVVSNRSAAKAAGADFKLAVNGKLVAVPAPASPGRPIVVDLTSWAGRDPSRVEVSSPASTLGMVSVTDSFFEPWTDTRSSRSGRHLDVSYSAAKVELGDVIQAHVRAVDRDPGLWSMLMVEVGLPPGAVVDEASLEAARVMKGSRIGRYEVEPSKVTFYLWSSTDPIEFQFAFRPRYAMKARSTMSRLWSYYDPEDEAVVAPVLFEVTGPKSPQDNGTVRAAVQE